MSETAPRSRLKEPSHSDLLTFISSRFDGIELRLEHGEKRFDRLEDKLDEAQKEFSSYQKKQGEMLADIQVLQANSDNVKSPPWWLGWKPIAALITLAVFAGAGLTALAIAGLDIVPKLAAIKDAVNP